LEFLYSEEAQSIAVKHRLRPRSQQLLAKHAQVFPKLKLFTIEEVFGTFKLLQTQHFDDGALFDQIMTELHKSP
jgi:sulfate transport system substrate-binding protein